MNFSGGINRPPYETADGYLQTTEGCSHNTCLFCTYFKDQKFRKSTIEEIEADIKEIAATFGAPKRIFLQGADGYAADYDVLMKTAELALQTLPVLLAIRSHISADNLKRKREKALKQRRVKRAMRRSHSYCASKASPCSPQPTTPTISWKPCFSIFCAAVARGGFRAFPPAVALRRVFSWCGPCCLSPRRHCLTT